MKNTISLWLENTQHNILQYWQTRTVREKYLLLFLTLFLIIVFFYVILWQNIFVKNQIFQQKKESAKVFQLWLNNQNNRVLQATQQGQRAAKLNAETLKGVFGNVAINKDCKLETGSAKQAKLSCEVVEFDGLLRWLGEMNRQYSVYAINTDIQPESVGKIRAEVILAWD